MLTEDQKQAILVLRENGKTYDAIAELIGVSPNTVKSFWRRNCAIHTKQNGLQKTSPDYCKNCGALLRQSKGAKRKVFCSSQCRYAWWNQYRRSQPYRLVCKECEKTFISFGNQKKAFCGRECYNLSRRPKGVP